MELTLFMGIVASRLIGIIKGRTSNFRKERKYSFLSVVLENKR